VAIRFACPLCKTTYTVEDRDAGTKSECKTCGQRLQVPAKPPAKTILGVIEPDNGESPVVPFVGGDQAGRTVLGDLELPLTVDSWAVPSELPKETPSFTNPPALGQRPARAPEKFQAIAFMLVLGGAWAIIWSLAGILLSAFWCLAWPGTYYGLLFGVLAILRGAEMMSVSPALVHSPRVIVIMQIITIVNGDVANLACGIVGLVFLNELTVQGYFRGPEYKG
jgi:hypothetical protein